MWRVVLGVIAVPFVLLFLWAAFSIVSAVTTWAYVQTWQPVEARVLSGGVRGTYEAYGEFAYVYDGKEYRSTHVQLQGGQEDVRGRDPQEHGHQKRFGEQLAAAAASGATMQAYMNPRNPAEAIIDRHFRWMSLIFQFFILGFMTVGFLVIENARFYMKRMKQDGLSLYKEKAWLHRRAWRINTIRPCGVFSLLSSGVTAIGWNVILWVPLRPLFESIFFQSHNLFVQGFILVFPVIGAVLALRFIRDTARWLRFGRLPVELDPYPGMIGGQVAGAIVLPYSCSVDTDFIVRLSRIDATSGRSNTEYIGWQSETKAGREPCTGGTRLTFAIDVPAGQCASETLSEQGGLTEWCLTVQAEMFPTNLDVRYEIPVYPHDQQATREALPPVTVTEEMRQQALVRIALRNRPEGEELFYSVQDKIVPLFICLLGVMILALSRFFGILICAGGIYAMFRSLTVYRDSAGSINSVRKIGAFTVKKTCAPAADVKSLQKKLSSTQMAAGGASTQYYKVFAVLPDDGQLLLGEGFKGAAEAEAAMAFIREKLGLAV